MLTSLNELLPIIGDSFILLYSQEKKRKAKLFYLYNPLNIQ